MTLGFTSNWRQKVQSFLILLSDWMHGCRCESMGKEVVYVSGRVRAPGEMNGKSGNMNNALNQIYPKEYAIPGNELVCVFDADQVAKRDFFLKTLPYFDAGERTSAF